MQLPVIRGLIDRRILVNYRVEADALRRVLPEPFRPQLVGGVGMAGICLIRLAQVRPEFISRFTPRMVPDWFTSLGLGSENAAHRIAVEWDDPTGEPRNGVYIPRRDTSSHLNRLVGGRLFPGYQHHARFQVHEADGRYGIRLDSDDGLTHLAVDARISDRLPGDSVFGSLDAASEFFRRGGLGYSATPMPGVFDGLELKSFSWSTTPLAIDHVESSFFDDARRFPRGTVEFDSALLMRRIEHQWHARESINS
ncbi:MAG TPA: hypothetical protein VHX65_13855 [Pirellulales bacterium]|jgi:hypothetical protein|nr:hypothetical protein [Pirellulales bacterium]